MLALKRSFMRIMRNILGLYLLVCTLSLGWTGVLRAEDIVEVSSIEDIKRAIPTTSPENPMNISLKLTNNIVVNSEHLNIIILDKVSVNFDGSGYSISYQGEASPNRGSLFWVGSGGKLSIYNTLLKDFISPSGNNTGGVLRVSKDGQLQVSKCTFQNNRSPQGSAIFNSGKAYVMQSTFVNNTNIPYHNDNQGGAIFNASTGAITIQNSTFTKNIALQGDAIYNRGHLYIHNSTLIQNGNATSTGGAIYNDGSNLKVFSSIIQDNVASTNAKDCGGNQIINLGYNLVTNESSCNQDNSRIDESADFLYANDQSILKRSNFIPGNKPGEGHFNLRIGSPAINKSASCTTPDQLGRSRGDNLCDIGAVEFVLPRFPADEISEVDNHTPLVDDTPTPTETTDNTVLAQDNPSNDQTGGGCSFGHAKGNLFSLSSILLFLPMLWMGIMKRKES